MLVRRCVNTQGSDSKFRYDLIFILVKERWLPNILSSVYTLFHSIILLYLWVKPLTSGDYQHKCAEVGRSESIILYFYWLLTINPFPTSGTHDTRIQRLY